MKATIESLNRAAQQLSAPMDAVTHGSSMRSADDRKAIALGAIGMGRMVQDNFETLRQWWNGAATMNATTYGGVSVDAPLQRQMIMTEALRAFERKFISCDLFAHTYNPVPLEGTDVVTVPYYPLFTTPSRRFQASRGYEFSGTDQALSKQITVGGVGPDEKVPGQDRAYQPLSLSSYLLRRQPWVEVQKLVTMRAEQLALDVASDIISTHIVKANFGNAVWSGDAGAFSTSSVLLLKGACDKSDWPDSGRNLVLSTDHYNNLLDDPGLHAYMNIGSTEPIRQGKIGGLYGFENTVGCPRIPATADGNLVGWASFPSAVGIALSPILPAPGVMKKLLAWGSFTNPQTNLTLTYRYGGDEWMDTDREVIECCYGSEPLEVAALKRLVNQGT